MFGDLFTNIIAISAFVTIVEFCYCALWFHLPLMSVRKYRLALSHLEQIMHKALFCLETLTDVYTPLSTAVFIIESDGLFHRQYIPCMANLPKHSIWYCCFTKLAIQDA